MRKVAGFVVAGALVLGIWWLWWRPWDSMPRPSGEVQPSRPVPTEQGSTPVETPLPAMTRTQVERPEDLLPWSTAALARQPKDQFAMPVAQVPYLHACLNRSEASDVGVSGTKAFYGVDFARIVEGLPSAELRAEARRREGELRGLIAQQSDAARVLEMEHWRQRYLDYHQAVESGDFVVVEHASDSTDAVRAESNRAALEALQLGRMNHDFVSILSSAKTSDNQYRPASAIVYLRRSKYPKSLELLDELRRLSEDAERVVRSRLGVVEPSTRAVFPR